MMQGSPLHKLVFKCAGMAVRNKGRDDDINTELNIHSPIPTSWGYVCLILCFYVIIPAFIAYCNAYTLFEYFLA